MRTEATIVLIDDEDILGHASELDADGHLKITDWWVVIGGRTRRLLSLRRSNEDSPDLPELHPEMLRPISAPDSAQRSPAASEPAAVEPPSE